MKILVIHDRPVVAAAIDELIRGLDLDGGVSVDIAEDRAEAAERLKRTIYDLVIVDLTLPDVKNQMAPNVRVVEGLLRELFTMGNLNVPGDVIGMSLEPDAMEVVTSNIGPHLMTLIHEDHDGQWRTYLGDRIRYAARAAMARQFSIFQHHDVDVLLVTALDEEFAPFHDHFDFLPVKQYPNAKRFLFKDKADESRTGIAFSIGRSGQPRAASRTQSLISVFRPRLAIMSGFCGGFGKKMSPGDLVFFETVYDWDYGKWERDQAGDAHFISRPVPLSVDGTPAHWMARDFVASDFNRRPQVLEQLHRDSEGEVDSFSMHLAQAASGSAVVAHEEVTRRMRQLNGGIHAVDMEAYGFYHAALHTHVVRPQVLCLKAVADSANPDKDDAMHRACSVLAASATVDILRHRWDFSAS